MFRFFLKKNFADGWDNMFFLMVSNVFAIVVLAAAFYGIRFSLLVNPFLPNAVLIGAGGILMTLIFAYGANAAKIANFGSGSFGTFFRAFSYAWRIGFFSGAALMLLVLMIRFGVIYYLSAGGFFSLAMIAFLGWFSFISACALQWFVPLYFLQEQNGFSKCLKKSFIIFFDNPLFSVGVFFHNVVIFLISCAFFMIVPGFFGLTLSSTNALRLRLKKYDWLEEMEQREPGFSTDRNRRNEIPWDDLLAEDRETLGPRKISSFIFPWK